MWLLDLPEDVVAAGTMWLLFTGVVFAYVLRIASLLHSQRQAERAYRLVLAKTAGVRAREGSASTSL